MTDRLLLPKRFIELNWCFASRIAELSGRHLADVLLDYTPLYIRFELGRSFDPSQPAWQEYLYGLFTCADPVEWTFQFYLGRRALASPRPLEPTFGCFSYSILTHQKIRLHFRNTEPPDQGPLAAGRRAVRTAELAALFSHVKREVAGATAVIGSSWLYNLEAYRRLFPPACIAAARPRDGEFRYLTLWGQFLDREANVREVYAEQFLDGLERQHSVPGVLGCFPLPVLSFKCALAPCYEFYQV